MTRTPCRFLIVGVNHSRRVDERLSDDVVATGPMDDLTAAYDAARLFIAPTRFSAGIPLKILEAAGMGLPVVATPLLLEQLGWNADKEILVGADAKTFARHCAALLDDDALWTKMRDGGLDAIKRDCDPRAFDKILRDLVDKMRPRVAAHAN